MWSSEEFLDEGRILSLYLPCQWGQSSTSCVPTAFRGVLKRAYDSDEGPHTQLTGGMVPMRQFLTHHQSVVDVDTGCVITSLEGMELKVVLAGVPLRAGPLLTADGLSHPW